MYIWEMCLTLYYVVVIANYNICKKAFTLPELHYNIFVVVACFVYYFNIKYAFLNVAA